jgi:hypothetical protein
MSFDAQSTEFIAAIVFGLLQLAVALVSLWQQRQLRLTYREWGDELCKHHMD